MQQRWYYFSVVAAILAALSLSAPVLAAGKQVPFKGRSSGVVTTVRVDEVAGIAYFRVEAQGQATHLGRFTATAVAEADVVTGDAHGTWTLTAANGDQLFLTIAATPGSEANQGIGGFTVTGGTGRFAGATGYYEQCITFDVAPEPSDTARLPTCSREDLLWAPIGARERCSRRGAHADQPYPRRRMAHQAVTWVRLTLVPAASFPRDERGEGGGRGWATTTD